MTTRFPQRPRAHQLETESNQFFRNHLPTGWVCDEPRNDYGIDLRVGMADNGQLNGHGFSVQLKASEVAQAGDSIPVRLKVATLNYLRQQLEVAILVTYVASEREAYWLMLKDAPTPSESQETITIRIPRTNALSNNPWGQISEYVSMVHCRKLGAMHSPSATG